MLLWAREDALINLALFLKKIVLWLPDHRAWFNLLKNLDVWSWVPHHNLCTYFFHPVVWHVIFETINFICIWAFVGRCLLCLQSEILILFRDYNANLRLNLSQQELRLFLALVFLGKLQLVNLVFRWGSNLGFLWFLIEVEFWRWARINSPRLRHSIIHNDLFSYNLWLFLEPFANSFDFLLLIIPFQLHMKSLLVPTGRRYIQWCVPWRKILDVLKSGLPRASFAL